MAVDATLALGAGTALALGAALVVLGPLYRGAPDEPLGDATPDAAAPTPGARAEGVSAVEALREIEFDRATGKLSDDDYAALKAAYTRDAIAELRAARGTGARPEPAGAAGVATVAAADDAVEEALRAYRARRATRPAAVSGAAHACVACGPRPEADAAFCSSCGRYLAAACPRCGAACEREAQRFCGDCGYALAPSADPSASPPAAPAPEDRLAVGAGA